MPVVADIETLECGFHRGEAEYFNGNTPVHNNSRIAEKFEPVSETLENGSGPGI